MNVRLAVFAIAPLTALVAVGCGPVPGGYGANPAHGGAVSTTPRGIEVVEHPVPTQAPSSGEVVVTVEVFQEELAPYGTWSEVEPYGTVWAANDPEYVPYQDGYWEYTEYGFTWVAETEWGWATEHYGRWVWLSEEWVWVPDDEWGPAWVEWRDAETMVGWAPLGPDDWRTIPPAEHWVFVDVSMVLTHEVYHYYQPAPVVAALWSTSARVSWTTGPAGLAYCPGPSYRSLGARNVVVQRTPSNSLYVGRRRPRRTAGAAGATSSRPGVRVRGGARPSVAVTSGARPRVAVDGSPRPTVRVDGPGRPTVVLRPTRPLPRAGVRPEAAAAARANWDRPRPQAILRPRPQTRVIGRRPPPVPQWQAPNYGGEASDSEVRAAVSRAQRYEAQRRLRPTPVAPPRPTVHAPAVTTSAPTVSAGVARPAISPGVAIPPSARPPRPTALPRGAMSPGPSPPRFAPRPAAPRVRAQVPGNAPRFLHPAAGRRPAVVTRPRAPAVRAPAPRTAAPRQRVASPGVAAPRPSTSPSFRSSPGVRVSSPSSRPVTRPATRPATQRTTPTVRRSSGPSLGRPALPSVRRN